MTGNLNLDTCCAATTLAPLRILEQEQIYYCEKISGALPSIEKRAPDISHESKFSFAKAAPKSARLGAGCQVPWQVFAQSLPQVSLPLLVQSLPYLVRPSITKSVLSMLKTERALCHFVDDQRI